MTDQEIARLVAQALGLGRSVAFDPGWWDVDPITAPAFLLREDGSNVFDLPWRWLCLEWLLAHRIAVEFMWTGSKFTHSAMGPEQGEIQITCPAAEFPARCLARLASMTMAKR